MKVSLRALTVILIVPLTSLAAPGANEPAGPQQQTAAPTDPAAQVKLGMQYALATPRNPREAMKWFKMAADQGYADGQYRLGGMYDVGINPQDPTEAAKWYLMAANQGYRDAEYRLGILYYTGRGVNQDYAQSAKWFQKAAEHGRPEAQYRIWRNVRERARACRRVIPPLCNGDACRRPNRVARRPSTKSGIYTNRVWEHQRILPRLSSGMRKPTNKDFLTLTMP